MLGSLYEGRLGVPPNRGEAVAWYSKALQQGYEDARKPLEALKSQKVLSSHEAASFQVTQISMKDPPLAKAARIRDDVVFEVAVDTTGAVKAYKIVKGHPLLNDAAIESIQTLRYRPYVVNGQPAEFVTTITLRYQY